MRITDLLRDEGILIGGAPADKDEAIERLVDLMVAEGNVRDRAHARGVPCPRGRRGGGSPR